MHEASTPTQPAPVRQLCSPEQLYGWAVEDRTGHVLGTVNHVLVDMVRGEIAYAVLASGGFLGLGESRFSLPWATLEMAPDGTHRFIWNGSASGSADAPASVPAALLGP